MTKSEREYCELFEPDGNTEGNLAQLALEADTELKQLRGILLDLVQQIEGLQENHLDLKPANDYFDAHPEHFSCPECNATHVKVDEDGCCSTCGTDTVIEDCDCKGASVSEHLDRIQAFEERSSKVDRTVS